MKPVQKAFLALVIANIIWGAASPIFKLSLQNIPLFTLAFWRFFLGAALLLTFFGPKVVHAGNLFRKDIKALTLFSLLGITFNIIFFFLGLQRTYSINAPVIASASPILTLMLALIFLKERFIPKKFIGMVIGTGGIILIVLEPLLLTGIDGSIVGNIFLIIATISAVFQTIVGKTVLHKYDPILFTFWSFVIGAASFLPLAVFEAIDVPTLYGMLDWRGFLGIAFGAVFSSAVAYTCYSWGLSKISASDVSMFTYIDPVIGTILGFLILREPITLPFILGSVLIFTGIFVAEGRIHYHPLDKILKSKL